MTCICPGCQALRESVALGPSDIVLHCPEHGSYVDRAHGTGDCPGCVAASPLAQWVREQLAK